MVGCWVANDSVFSSQVGDEIALMNQETSKYFTLNNTGALIWEVLQTPSTLPEIVQTISEKYSVDPSVCEQDVKAVLNHMKESKLVKEID